jgi:hypothetical protein
MPLRSASKQLSDSAAHVSMFAADRGIVQSRHYEVSNEELDALRLMRLRQRVNHGLRACKQLHGLDGVLACKLPLAAYDVAVHSSGVWAAQRVDSSAELVPQHRQFLTAECCGGAGF